MTQDANARLEGLRKQAKRLLKALRTGDAEAQRRMAKWLPRASPKPGLRGQERRFAACSSRSG